MPKRVLNLPKISHGKNKRVTMTDRQNVKRSVKLSLNSVKYYNMNGQILLRQANTFPKRIINLEPLLNSLLFGNRIVFITEPLTTYQTVQKRYMDIAIYHSFKEK